MPASASLQASGNSRAETAVRTRALGTSSAAAAARAEASGSISSSSAPCASSSPAVARAMPPAPPVITISRFSNSMQAPPRGRRHRRLGIAAVKRCTFGGRVRRQRSMCCVMRRTSAGAAQLGRDVARRAPEAPVLSSIRSVLGTRRFCDASSTTPRMLTRPIRARSPGRRPRRLRRPGLPHPAVAAARACWSDVHSNAGRSSSIVTTTLPPLLS